MGDAHLHLHPHAGEPDLHPGAFPPELIESYVEAAADRGVGEVGFTEHLYRCKEAAPALGRFWERESQTNLGRQTERFVMQEQTLSLEAYVEAVLSAQQRGLPVLLASKSTTSRIRWTRCSACWRRSHGTI